MFPIGLGALEQGYDQAALSYWQRRQLEQGNQADIALGKMFQNMAAGGMPSGPPPMPMAPPAMGGGGPPGAGPPMMPPGGAGPAPGGSAGYPRMPYTPVQGPPGAPMQLGPGAMTGPSAPRPMMPPGGGPPMGGAPGMPSGPPGAVPLPGGPPPGFVNPPQGQFGPNNLTGPPNIPPGGIPGFGGGGPAGPPAPRPPPNPGPGPMGMPGSPGAMPRLGTMGWEDLARRITSANPGAPPEVIAQAMTKAMPFMTAQAQQDWRSIELQLQFERNRVYEESVRQRPGIAAMRPEVQLLDKWWETHPDGTPEQAADFLRSTKGGGARETPAQTALKTFLQEHKDDNEGRGPTAQEIQDFTNKPAFTRQERNLTAAAERQKVGTESREGIAAAGREATGERAAAGRQSREGIAAAGRESREGIAAAGREAAAERATQSQEAAAGRQQTGIAAKQAPIKQQAASVSTQIDSIVNDIQDSQKGGPAVTGFQGGLQRWYEWGGGLIGETGETRATVFQSKVRALQAQIPRLLAGVGRISAEERAHIDQIVRGLGAFTDPQGAIDSLNYLKEIIRSRTAGDLPAGSGGAASPGGKKPARASQQPAEPPPASMLREDMERDIKYPDGSVHTWVLRNGEPVEVRGGGGVRGPVPDPRTGNLDSPQGAPPPYGGQGADPFDQPPPPAGEGRENLSAADKELKFTPQEKALYERHLTNLMGSGGVDNPDGSRSSLLQLSFEEDGKTYNIPSVWDGKILKPQDAIARARKEGLDKFPAYSSEAEAEARYDAMHKFMERDTAKYLKGKEKHTKNINPVMKAGRDAVVDYFMRASERTTESLLNIVKDPISLVGTTTFGGANPGPTVLRSLLRSGKSLKAIGEEFGVSAVSASKWLKKYGLDAVGTPGAKPKIDDEKLKELVLVTTDKRGVAAKQEGIKSWREVGKELGVSAAAAYQRAKKLGLIPE